MLNFYGASKIWHAPLWQEARADGFSVNSRWIDIEGDSESDPIYQGKVISRETIWNLCLDDVTAADCVILYCGSEDEEQRGAIMEAGHAMGQGKKVYAINYCKTVSPCKFSDVAFTHHKLWNWVDRNNWLTFEEGLRRAVWMAQNDMALEREAQLKELVRRSA